MPMTRAEWLEEARKKREATEAQKQWLWLTKGNPAWHNQSPRIPFGRGGWEFAVSESLDELAVDVTLLNYTSIVKKTLDDIYRRMDDITSVLARRVNDLEENIAPSLIRTHVYKVEQNVAQAILNMTNRIRALEGGGP